MKTQDPIKTIEKRLFRQNKGRSAVAAAAIILTTLLFTTLFVLSQSMKKNMVTMAFRQSGYDAQVSFKSITDEQANLIAGHPDVREVGRSIVLGLAENKDLTGRQVEIRWADQSYAEHSFSAPVTGGMPQKKDEIALDTITLDKLGLPHELGQQVVLEWRKDLTSEEVTRSTFTLCGFWEGNESVYASMAWVDREYAQEVTGQAQQSAPGQVLGIHMAQVHLNSDKDISGVMDGVLRDTGLEELTYGENLAYSEELSATAARESLPIYLGMSLIFAAGYLIIYNIFQISVTTDIQFYGRLKTLGATQKQIKKLIYRQAGRLCVMGIPVGLVTGYLLGAVLVPVLLGGIKGQTSAAADPVVFAGAALFAGATVVISCMRPARLAGKVSPMEALRYDDVQTVRKRQEKKTSRLPLLMEMAWESLGRNKKRTITVVCSLTLALVLLSCFYAKNAAFDMEKYLSDLTIADLELADATHEDQINGYDPEHGTLSPRLIQEIDAAEGLEEQGSMYSHETGWDVDEATLQNLQAFYTPEVLEDWKSYDSSGAAALEEVLHTKKAVAVLYGLEGIPLQQLCRPEQLLDGEIDMEQFLSGGSVIAIAPSVEKTQDGRPLPTPSVGAQVTIEGKTYTVMAVVKPMEPISGGASEDPQGGFSLSFALPVSTFVQQWPDNSPRKLFYNVEEGAREDIQLLLEEYTAGVDSSLQVTSRQSMEEQYKTETRSSAVLGNALSLVIALVGILNFLNSMVTAIFSRRKEFAMIQSVGMTKRQLRSMLILEGLFYTALTLVSAYGLSALGVGVVVRAMVAGGYSTFRFTLRPLLFCTPILAAIAVVIPWVCFHGIEKQSIVERLRIDR